MKGDTDPENAVVSLGDRRRNLVAVITSMTVTSLIYGLSYPLLALSLKQQGVDTALIGLNAGAQGLAIFAVAPLAPRLIRWLAPARLMLIAVALSLVLFLLLPVFPGVLAWFPLRFLLGCTNTVLWIAGEAWINELADEKARGRVVGLYGSALAAGFALGPVLLAETGTEGWVPFIVSAAIIGLSAVPLLFAAPTPWRTTDQAAPKLLAFLFLAPAAMLANAVAAAADGALITFLPIYGIALGLEENAALYMVTAMGLGGIVCQVPIGWLADHIDRRLVLTLCVVILLGTSALLPVLMTAAPWNWACLFVMGGALGGLYTVGLILVGEQFEGASLAAAVTVFSSMWGLGSIVGAPIVGGVMEIVPGHGLAVALGAIFLVYLPFPLRAFLCRRAAD